MKRNTLYAAMLTLFCSVGYADEPKPATPADSATPTQTTAQPPSQESSIPAPVPQIAPVIDCQYHIPAQTTTIDQTILSTWAGKAAVQSFDFSPATIDEQLDKLKTCFTDQGWQGYSDAFQKSGNLNSIKAQHLTVSSQTDGDVVVNPVKENQWKVNVPIQVVYQNDKEKFTQLLTLDLLVGRKISGDLGIMQIIATPRVSAETQPATDVAPADATPAAK